jgi:putative pyruvate formate lyase activating enzyme
MVSYLRLSKKELGKRVERAWRLLNPCRVCPRKCGVDRQRDEKTLRQAQGKLGFCQMGKNPVVSSYHAHPGEENVIRGRHGSGIIFFTSCNLSCVFCFNWEISQERVGNEVSIDRLAEIMVKLQKIKCHNINLCSPSIWVPQILKALVLAREKGLKLPLVYNTGGYDSVETLKLLDGIVDIYMPDMKYSDDTIGQKYSLVPKYWTVNKKAVKEMFRQVGDLKINKEGIAERGLLIRHLVLPGGLAGTEKVMKFIASLSKNSYVNIMDQYYPSNKADQYPEINRRITPEEFKEAIKISKRVGLHRFDKNLKLTF